jgi:hypothetical protein
VTVSRQQLILTPPTEKVAVVKHYIEGIKCYDVCTIIKDESSI